MSLSFVVGLLLLRAAYVRLRGGAKPPAGGAKPKIS